MMIFSSANSRRGDIMMRTITNASEQYRNAIRNCREIFTAAGREFAEPKGVSDLLNNARKLYAEQADEAAAVREVDHAREWLNGVAIKFLRGGVEFFDGRIKELSYMSLDSDIMDDMTARLRVFRDVMVPELNASLEQRIASYTELAGAVKGARMEQFRRNEERERLAHERAANEEQERRERLRLLREQEAREAAEAEAAARAQREKQFDELFA